MPRKTHIDEEFREPKHIKPTAHGKRRHVKGVVNDPLTKMAKRAERALREDKLKERW